MAQSGDRIAVGAAAAGTGIGDLTGCSTGGILTAGDDIAVAQGRYRDRPAFSAVGTDFEPAAGTCTGRRRSGSRTALEIMTCRRESDGIVLHGSAV